MKLPVRQSLVIASGIALSASLLAPLAAQAQQGTGLYVGAGVGQSKARDACKDFSAPGLVGSCDDKDTGWKLYLGYQFHPNFALEGGYVDFGKAGLGGTLQGVPFNGEFKAKTWHLDAVGIVPLQNNFSVFGKAGVHRWNADLNVAALGQRTGASHHGTDFTFGFGGGYEFTPNLGLRLEWERFKNVGDQATTGQSDVDLLSVGLRYRY